MELNNENPINIIQQWLQEAKQSELNDYNAMTLATTNKQLIPSARMVLLKKIENDSFYFFTNKNSNKANDIYESPYVSLLFHWKTLRKQIRITGKAIPTDKYQNQQYFSTRSNISQMGAWASKQSKPLESKQKLLDKVQYYQQKFESYEKIPCPEHWGGFKVIPEKIELWIDGNNRLHDRFLFSLNKDKMWTKQRLYP